MIIPSAKMAYVASVERGNRLFVSLESFESGNKLIKVRFMLASHSFGNLDKSLPCPPFSHFTTLVTFSRARQ